MLSDFKEIISKLEKQKAAIDQALAILRDFSGDDAEQATSPRKTSLKRVGKKRVMSEEGRKRIAEASKRRWAAVRKAAKKAA